MQKFVLDACAITSVYLKEKSYEKVEDIFLLAESQEAILYLNWVTYGEIIYSLKRELPDNKVEEIKNQIKKELNIKFVGINEEITELAAQFKAIGRLSYPDAFIVATAVKHKATIITKDKEFSRFEKNVKIDWI